MTVEEKKQVMTKAAQDLLDALSKEAQKRGRLSLEMLNANRVRTDIEVPDTVQETLIFTARCVMFVCALLMKNDDEFLAQSEDWLFTEFFSA